MADRHQGLSQFVEPVRAIIEKITTPGLLKQAAIAVVLFDTGATKSIISLALAKRIASIVPADRRFDVVLADGSKAFIDTMAMIAVDLNGHVISDRFYILASSAVDLILGVSTLGKYRMKIDFGEKTITGEMEAAVLAASIFDDDSPANSEIVAVLELLAGSLCDECCTEIRRLQERNARVHSFIAEEAARLVDQTVNPDGRGISKLWPDQREYIIAFAKDHGLTTLNSFLEGRQPISFRMRNGVKNQPIAAAAVVSDDIQREINKLLGVSCEVFKKYYH